MAIEKVLDQVKPEEKGTPEEKPQGDTVKPEDAKEATVEIDGKKVPVSQVQEAMEALENKGKWQKELTQKGQKIAEDAKIVEQFKPYSDWSKLPENAEKVTEIQDILDRKEEIKEETKEALAEVELDSPAVAKILKKYDTTMAGFQKTIVAMQQGILQKQDDANVRAVEKEVEDVKLKYKNLTEKDIDKIVKLAANGENLVTIADEYVADLEEFKTRSVTEYLQKKEKDNGNFVETGPAGTSPEVKTKLYGNDKTSSRSAFAKDIKRMNRGGD